MKRIFSALSLLILATMACTWSELVVPTPAFLPSVQIPPTPTPFIATVTPIILPPTATLILPATATPFSPTEEATITPTTTPTSENTVTATAAPASPTATQTVISPPTETASPQPPTTTLPPSPTPLPTIPSSTPATTFCLPVYSSTFEQEVVTLINEEREKAGLDPLTMQPQLRAAARGHSEDMACNDFISHTGSNGSSPWARIQAQGYTYSMAAENVAGGQTTPRAVVDAWLESNTHRVNILSPDFIHIGVGYTYRENSTFGAYWTAVFAKP